MTETTESIETVISNARKHDSERISLDTYFAPFVDEWVDLQFQAGNFSRDDKLRGYWYEQTTEDAVIFHSESQYRDDRGDFDPLEEKYIYIPISFITSSDESHRIKLAEMIKTRNAELDKAEQERQERRAAFRSA